MKELDLMVLTGDALIDEIEASMARDGFIPLLEWTNQEEIVMTNSGGVFFRLLIEKEKKRLLDQGRVVHVVLLEDGRSTLFANKLR